MSINSFDKLTNIFHKYKLTKEEQYEVLNIIRDLFIHDEFQRRLTDEFLHHGSTTLGEHILEDTVLTYLLSKKYKNNSNFNMEYALKIAMMHDLYTKPWQNAGVVKNNFFHRHGFAHPIEAAINANIWYQEEFQDEKKSKIIIDGIVHHMYPFPVMSYYDNDSNELELNNFEFTKQLSEENRKLLIESSNRFRMGDISISKSKYKEGRIMSLADKLVSLKQIKSIYDATALVTGNNKKLIKK